MSNFVNIFLISIVVFVFVFVIVLVINQRESYDNSNYDTLTQAYEVPFTEYEFIASGERPAVGHYLRLYETPSLTDEYEDNLIENDECDRCMFNCLNPVSLFYDKKESLRRCKEYCKDECKNTDLNKIIQISKNINPKENYHYESNYYDQGGWMSMPEWME